MNDELADTAALLRSAVQYLCRFLRAISNTWNHQPSLFDIVSHSFKPGHIPDPSLGRSQIGISNREPASEFFTRYTSPITISSNTK
jgi:hypothetical protein